MIYSTGDRGDALFIINRGVVEVVNLPRLLFTCPAACSWRRETLSGLPRRQVARTCEPVSLQCFKLRDFPELIRRVPSFFHFLSSQLAFRLAQAADLATTPGHSLELSGTRSELRFDHGLSDHREFLPDRPAADREPDEEVISAFFFDRQPRCGQVRAFDWGRSVLAAVRERSSHRHLLFRPEISRKKLGASQGASAKTRAKC